MSRVRDIYDVIDSFAPFSSAMGFDNVGVLVGDSNTPVTRALVALDITLAVVEEAASMNANLIISHHPIIFHPLKRLASQDVPYQLAKHSITALCCHTNVDRSPICGTNVALGQRLGLCGLHLVEFDDPDVVLFEGDLPAPIETDAWVRQVKEQLGLSALHAVLGQTPVQRVCFCSGAGGDFLPQAIARGADAFLTGELPHHLAIEAAASGLTVLAAGHYETEKPFAAPFAAYLKKRCPDTAFLLSKTEQSPLTVW